MTVNTVTVLAVILYVLGIIATTFFVEDGDGDHFTIGLLAVFWPLVLPFALVMALFYGAGYLGHYLRSKLP